MCQLNASAKPNDDREWNEKLRMLTHTNRIKSSEIDQFHFIFESESLDHVNCMDF